MLVCKKCNFEKEEVQFYRRDSGRIRLECKDCILKQRKVYQANNKQKIAERKHKTYLENQEEHKQREKKRRLERGDEIRERARESRKLNPEKFRQRDNERYQKNKEVRKECSRRSYRNKRGHYVHIAKLRTFNKRRATPPWLTEEHKKQIKNIYEECSRLTNSTGIDYNVDHIIPINGKEVCGLHVPWNLRVITQEENFKKHNKLLKEFSIIGEENVDNSSGGKRGVGKDVFADVLVKNHNYTRIALADPLRELCSKVFRMDYNLFLDQDKKDSQIPDGRLTLDFHHIDKIRTYVTEHWNYDIDNDARDGMEQYHGEEFDTPRDILRCVGTRLLREHVSDSIWLELAMSKIRVAGGKVIVTDCRFENERDLFGKCGALLVLIKRHDDGNSFQHEFNLGKEEEYDVVFDNSGTLNEFKSNVNTWYTLRSKELELYRVFKYD